MDRTIEDRLVRLAAVIALLGVSFAAEDALANDETDLAAMALAIEESSRNTLESASEANAQSAARAVASLACENSIELDIKLEDHTSTLIANEE